MTSKSLKSKQLFVSGLAISLLCLILLLAYLNEPNEHPAKRQWRNNATITRVNPAKERRLPQAIIIGTRKCGTRALARFLEVNPAIRSAPREVHFFDRQENYRQGLEWYRDQMPPTDPSQLTIEKSPAYFVTHGVPERIRAMNASIKLIVIMRNPVTRLMSDFSQLAIKSNSFNDYEQDDEELNDVVSGLKMQVGDKMATLMLNEERELERYVTRPDGGIDEQRRIVRTGMYTVHLERWLAMFPREQFHYVDGERLIREPHVELQKLERFLGFEQPLIKEEHFVFSSKKGFYCLASGRQSRKKRHSGEAIADNLPVCLGKSKGRRHVSISPELRGKLDSLYSPYNEYLLSLTGLNFTSYH